MIGLLLIGSVLFLFSSASFVNQPSAASIDSSLETMASPRGISPAAVGRVPTLWPFSRDSIWNLPIGAEAVYVPANIKQPGSRGMTVDPDVLILTPDAPMTSVYYNNDGWSGGSRCDAEGGALFDAPIPADFVVPGAHSGFTPNFATAILLSDNRTLKQGQPMARCTPDGTATMWWYVTNDLYDTGLYGGHGGSMLSSIGGTLRLGELVPSGAIRHVLKINLYGADNYWYDSATRGFRWPAKQADGCASGCYGGSNPVLRMGSLLALPASVDIASMGLETEPALILAQALQDYGGYTVDDTAWSVYGIATEFSPSGRIEDEFNAAWGFPIDPESKDVPWARDIWRIFSALNVVDNWNAATWATVSASDGLLGAGLGLPRVAWAPDFGTDGVPPVTTASLSGTLGGANYYISPVQVTLNATDDSGVASITFRTDGGAWQTYTAPVTVQGDGSHAFDYYATDLAGNKGAVKTATIKIDTVSPGTTSRLDGILGSNGWYKSPVTATLTATDAGSGVAAIHVRTDGASWQVYSSPVRIPGDGPHIMEFYATDAAGTNEATRSTSFQIDSVAPTTAVQIDGTLGTDGSYSAPVQVTLLASDATSGVDSTRYRIDGGAWRTFANPFPLAGNGAHVLEYATTDRAGNAEPVQSWTIRISGDTRLPPTTVLSSAGTSGANGWYVSSVTVTLSATSPSGAATFIMYRLDGGSWASYSSSFAFGEGRHVLEYQSSDADGYFEPVTSATVNVDLTPPTVERAGSPTDLVPVNGAFSWVGTDSASGVARYEVSVDGGPFESIGSATSVTRNWSIGTHAVIVTAIDNAGNEGTTTMTFSTEGINSSPGFGPIPTLPLSTTGTTLFAIIAGIVTLAGALWYLPRRKERRARGSSKGHLRAASKESNLESSSVHDEIEEF